MASVMNGLNEYTGSHIECSGATEDQGHQSGLK